MRPGTRYRRQRCSYVPSRVFLLFFFFFLYYYYFSVGFGFQLISCGHSAVAQLEKKGRLKDEHGVLSHNSWGRMHIIAEHSRETDGWFTGAVSRCMGQDWTQRAKQILIKDGALFGLRHLAGYKNGHIRCGKTVGINEWDKSGEETKRWKDEKWESRIALKREKRKEDRDSGILSSLGRKRSSHTQQKWLQKASNVLPSGDVGCTYKVGMTIIGRTKRQKKKTGENRRKTRRERGGRRERLNKELLFSTYTQTSGLCSVYLTLAPLSAASFPFMTLYFAIRTHAHGCSSLSSSKVASYPMPFLPSSLMEPLLKYYYRLPRHE